MDVIFLDIDGVLNSNLWNESHQKEIEEGTLIDRNLVSLLGILVKTTNTKIILSSGWRFWFNKKMNPLRTEAERLVEFFSMSAEKVYSTYGIGIDKDADVKASNIKLSSDGTTFDVTFKGSTKKYQFETKLLGKANVYNILAGIALGYHLGISIPKLIMGVKKVKPVEHRLELKKMGSINIIDDAYNSNPVGSKMALDVLKLMPGKKIIVTPGMIEMGSEEYEINKTFGKQIADACDEVILIGEKQTKPIYDGLIEKKYPKNKIHILDDVKLAFPLFNRLAEKETYVLLENDLPDIFNEDMK